MNWSSSVANIMMKFIRHEGSEHAVYRNIQYNQLKKLRSTTYSTGWAKSGPLLKVYNSCMTQKPLLRNRLAK